MFCFFLWHKWSGWSEARPEPAYGNVVLAQWRECSKCGLRQREVFQ